MTLELLEKAWREVGKFIWAFTNVERGLDQLLVALFELNPISEEIFLNSLDLRKKINIAEVALNYQFYKHQLGRLHKLHDIRNNIAHRAFLPLGMEIEGKESEGKKDGISFSYPTIQKNLGFKTVFYTFDQFNEYFLLLTAISAELEEIGRACKPVGRNDEAVISAIQEIGNDNVVEFPDIRRP